LRESEAASVFAGTGSTAWRLGAEAKVDDFGCGYFFFGLADPYLFLGGDWFANIDSPLPSEDFLTAASLRDILSWRSF
jgi:hypothetical protein